MMMTNGGCERTETQWQSIVSAAGLKIAQIWFHGDGKDESEGVLECEIGQCLITLHILCFENKSPLRPKRHIPGCIQEIAVRQGRRKATLRQRILVQRLVSNDVR